MADVTISELARSTPSGGFLLPYGTGTSTLATPISALFHSAGNIGIGTANPDAPLCFSQGSGERISLYRTNNNYRFGLGVWQIPNTTSFNTRLYGPNYSNAGVQIGTMDQSDGTTFYPTLNILGIGHVGIGTTTPACRLDVVGSGTVLRIAAGGGTDNNQGGQFIMTNTNPGVPNPIKWQRVNSGGAYEVVNSSYVSAIFNLTDAGAAYQGNNSASWSTISDIKLKENIRPISCALEKINGLKPCHFEYKNQLGKTKTGFVAQEFENVFPGHVTNTNVSMQFESVVDKSEQIKTIDMDLIPYLTKAIQELLLRIEKIEERLKY